MSSETSTPIPRTFGFIGLGAMGFPMAQNLRRKISSSSIVYVYDIDENAMQRFSEEASTEEGGARVQVTGCAKEVAEGAECIITIVPEGSHVKSVYLAPEAGLLAAVNISDKLFIDCSTIDIPTSLQVGKAVQEAKALFFDAPVSGGTPGASAGTLTFMLGAAPASPHLPILISILSLMGKHIHPTGGPSLGLASKLSNNYLSGLIALATAEAMNIGMRLGVDPHTLSRCFQTGSGGSWVNETVNPVPGVCPAAVTSRGYEGGFKVQLMKKDMGLAIDAAKHVGAKIVLGDAGLEAYTATSEDPRCRDRDSRVIYRWLGGFEPQVAQPSK